MANDYIQKIGTSAFMMIYLGYAETPLTVYDAL